jgi:hypothetical protein
MRYRTTIIIESDQDPKNWDMQNFYYAIENGDAEELSRNIETPPAAHGTYEAAPYPPPEK